MIDHVIYAAPALDSAIAEFSQRFGVTPVSGGRHIGWGTRNALVGLGEKMYLELVGLDPEQDVPVDTRFLSLDVGSEPRFAAWCARGSRPLEEITTVARSVGYDLGEISSMSRTRDDGSTISWKMTSPMADREGGVLPFYIDWGISPHPASSLESSLSLVSVTAIHPDASRIRAILDALGEHSVHVEEGLEPALKVVLR